MLRPVFQSANRASTLRWLSRVAIVLALLCVIASMLKYPGGDQFGGRDSGFSLLRNYFCDLTSKTALNGQPNVGLRWAQLGMVLLAGALVLFWLAIDPGTSKRDRWARRLGVSSALIGLLLPVGRLSIAEVDIHPAITLGAGVPAIVAIALSVASAASRRAWWEACVGGAALAASALTAAVYGSFLVWDTVPAALPVVQKIAAILICAWMIMPHRPIAPLRDAKAPDLRARNLGPPR